MGGNGKHRWRISFHRSNSSAKQPPKEFICLISDSLMSDPVRRSSAAPSKSTTNSATRPSSPTRPDLISPI
ncbi:hypothetical protein ACLB2K_041261 [Fragaria x ananassa]